MSSVNRTEFSTELKVAAYPSQQEYEAQQSRFDDYVNSLEWQEAAVCIGQTALFYHPYGTVERTDQREGREAKAQKLCAACPVLNECRTYARTNREFGYWGAESEKNRADAGYFPPV